MEEIQKAHQEKIGELEKSNVQKFDSMIKSLNTIFDRLVILEKWTWMTLGACSLAAFVVPFIVRFAFPKL